MNIKLLFYCAFTASALISCNSKKNEPIQIIVKNTLDIPRTFETIEISKSDLNLGENINFSNLQIRDKKTQETLVSQFVDQDQDGTFDLLLFQPKLEANSEKVFELINAKSFMPVDTTNYCYSRFVPERIDDYAWENNKVAFRTYGPKAQKMVEDTIKGGTLSSGIDAWLKKVDYPIINKWYKKTTTGKGTYHEDTGEGLDNFHVGQSRGVGGTAVKEDSTYYISKNFIKWKTLTNGPIRTSFVLSYADWDANGQTITEEKHISLDYGSNFSRFEVYVNGTDTLSVGLTLHENNGEITENIKEGWVSYWEPHEGSELGTAIIGLNKETMVASDYYVTPQVDLSNLYAQFSINNGKVVYYAGFAWKESGQYPTKTAWEKYVQEFSRKVNSPIQISIK